MSWSLGEARALAVKAARGAGLPWGLAEEAGFALRWLQARGLPGAQALAAYLEWRAAGGVTDTESGPHCPLLLGAALADNGELPLPAELGQVGQPLLLAPALAWRAPPEGLVLHWQNAELNIFRHVAVAGNDASLFSVRADCRLVAAPASAGEPRRLPLSDGRIPERAAAAVAVLEQLAALTYAPASERSRLTGAGAGLDDND